MLPIFEQLRVDGATIGNHDLDFGEGVLAKWIQRLPHCAWVLSNIEAASTRQPLANCQPSALLACGAFKVGIVGLMEEEALATIPSLPPHVFLEPLAQAARCAAQLRADGADVVVALTHCRTPNTLRIGAVPGVDVVLGGHEHELLQRQNVIISGSDFRHVGVVDVTLAPRALAFRHVDVSPDTRPSPSMLVCSEWREPRHHRC